MNPISSKKLLQSKWTAVKPENKEKHFTITEVEFDEDETVVSCTMEAIISKRSFLIQWKQLKDATQWLQGWK